METNRDNISAEDKSRATLVSPRFDEETRASARPVVPLGQTSGARAAVRNVRKTWLWGVVLIFIISVALGIAANLIYRNSGKSAPSVTPMTARETVINAVPQPRATSPSDQPVRAREFETSVTSPRRMEPQNVLTAHDESGDRDWKEEERRDKEEEKFAERARKEEKKSLKRQRKEAEKLADDERDSEESARPKARLVGVYTIRRKH